MIYLLAASLLWSFSFGLIKGTLSELDPNLVSFIRISISLLIFLPFLKAGKFNTSLRLKLMLTGAVQYGLMYMTYIYSFRYLKGYEVAVFTIFTPIYVSLIHDLIRHRFHRRYLALSLLAIAGTAVVVYREISSEFFLPGFILLQFSNLFFAWGQVRYREIMKENPDISDKNVFAFLYAGAFAVTLVAALITTDIAHIRITGREAAALLYLGAIPSGIAFFLWNSGVRRSGIGTISIMNNLKIPLAVIVSIAVFGERGNLIKTAIGCAILVAALLYNEYSGRDRSDSAVLSRK